jgi:4-hydroxyproline epimerase
LALGARWRQESVTGSLFTGWLEEEDGQLIPQVRGTAFIIGEATLRFDPTDPFRAGFTTAG